MKKEYDYSKLRGRIVEKFGSIANFAKSMDEYPNVICEKLANKRGISRETIIDWSERLDISKEDYGDFFITLKVCK